MQGAHQLEENTQKKIRETGCPSNIFALLYWNWHCEDTLTGPTRLAGHHLKELRLPRKEPG